MDLAKHSVVKLENQISGQFATGATGCLAATVAIAGGGFFYRAAWGDAGNITPQRTPTVAQRRHTVNVQNNVTLTSPDTQVSPPEFVLPDGVYFDAPSGLWLIIHEQQVKETAFTQLYANAIYADLTTDTVLVNANGRTRTVTVDRSPQPQQPALTDDWYTINHVGGVTRVSRDGEMTFEEVQP